MNEEQQRQVDLMRERCDVHYDADYSRGDVSLLLDIIANEVANVKALQQRCDQQQAVIDAAAALVKRVEASSTQGNYHSVEQMPEYQRLQNALFGAPTKTDKTDSKP